MIENIRNFSKKKRNNHTSSSSKIKECFFSPRDGTVIIHWDTVPVHISDENDCPLRDDEPTI